MIFRTSLLAMTLTLSLQGAQAESLSFATDKVRLRADVVTDNLEHPWGLAFLPGGGAIVTERPGRIRILTDSSLSKPVAGVPKVAVGGEGGLLDIAVSRDFETSGTIFFAYSEAGPGGIGTTVARARLVRDGSAPRLEDLKVIFATDKKSQARVHFGARIIVNDDGTLFITTGDLGQRMRSQDMHDAAGAVVRIKTDGSIPSDNPSPDGRKMAPEIWSKGHRNIQGASLDPVMGGLMTVEHGAKGGDEINHPEAGKNYGWPVITYGTDYDGSKIGIGTAAPGYEQPLYYWDPSIAPSGLVSYRGKMFPEWQGDLLVGALKYQMLVRLHRDASGKILSEERMLQDSFGRIRDVVEAPDGAIWLLTDEDDGTVIRLSRAD
ncbi:PQQ-dependent sugar dehydrogenase [Aminobacter sp. MET-1]|uniref:PQQ-dependent sugar dehydrogenase n=1 Tax=Aminobacter sp. MET-1 TaxID=2951085 RepID=UPI002269FEC9|nr:PQQ-dependent sugar dehydrogenase [Aminobacter sp. MET-1]MCX8568575.1 PQQ-dependent sugar dehydrogenase [Aminobacter sp. MET-1]